MRLNLPDQMVEDIGKILLKSTVAPYEVTAPILAEMQKQIREQNKSFEEKRIEKIRKNAKEEEDKVKGVRGLVK